MCRRCIGIRSFFITFFVIKARVDKMDIMVSSVDKWSTVSVAGGHPFLRKLLKDGLGASRHVGEVWQEQERSL